VTSPLQPANSLLTTHSPWTWFSLPNSSSSSSSSSSSQLLSNPVILFMHFPMIRAQPTPPKSTPTPSSSPSSRLEPHYTELVEKAALLQTLEDLVSRRNVTFFAPVNHALDREFKLFLQVLEPRNPRSLQTLLLSHIVPKRVSLDA
jgi:hypothetical protein